MNSGPNPGGLLRALGEASRVRRLLSALLVLAAAVLVTGVVTEHVMARATSSALGGRVEAGGHASGGETTVPTGGPTATAGVTPSGHSEQGEPAGHVEGSGETAGSASGGTRDAERVLGLQTESPVLVTVAVLVSLGAAVLVLVSRRRAVVLGAGALAGAFVVLDCAELIHQVGEARPTIAALAGLTKGLHVAAAVAAAAVILHRQGGQERARV